VHETKATVPSDPQPPELISAGATVLQLHWPPPPDGGAEITHYVLQRDYGWGSLYICSELPMCKVWLVNDTPLLSSAVLSVQ